MSKTIYFADKNLNAVAVSKEEALLKGMTRWQGWYCSLGINNLHITADGNAYGATCKVGGLLNNIYDHFGKFPEFYTPCSKEVCACGADMLLKKSKIRKNIGVSTNLSSKQLNFVSELTDEVDYIGPIHEVEPEVSVTWDLGRRCNYSCDYCNSSISNNFESHKSKGSLEFAYNKLKDLLLRGRRAKFIFTGGEPTINPAYSDFVKLIHSDGHLIHTQTNGSLTPEYYSELIKYSFIGISVHLQFYNRERLLKNISAIVATIKSDEKYKFQWFGVRIMAPPNRVDEAEKLFLETSQLKSKLDANFELIMSPVYEKNNENALQVYSESEFAILKKYV